MRISVILLVAALGAAASPAGAQFAPRALSVEGGVRANAVPGWGNGLSDVRDRIDNGRRSGQLSRHEAHQLRREAGLIGDLGTQFGRDGLSDAEAQELAVRTTVLRDEVDAQRLGVEPQRGR